MKMQILKRVFCMSVAFSIVVTGISMGTVQAAFVGKKQMVKSDNILKEEEILRESMVWMEKPSKESLVQEEADIASENAEKEATAEDMYGWTEDGLVYVLCTIGGKTVEDRCLAVVNYNGTAEEITLPSSVQGWQVYMLARGVFNDRSDIKKIVLPDSVEIIEDGCLKSISGLEEVHLGGITGIYYKRWDR